MSIDLESKEGRKKYLSDKLDDLLEGVNDSYGSILMEELLNRLELTIMDFNDEMKALCDELVKKQEERMHLLEMLQSKNTILDESKSLDINDSSLSEDVESEKNIFQTEGNIPVWEKKLAKLEKNKK